MYDISKHFTFTLDIKKSSTLNSEALKFNYGDDVTLNIKITDEQKPKDISHCKVDLIIANAILDNPLIHRYEDGGISIVDNEIVIICKDEYIDLIGTNVCQLIIRDTNQSITTQMFTYQVLSTLISNDMIIATDKINTLLELEKAIEYTSNKLITLDGDFDTVKTNLENANQSIETSITELRDKVNLEITNIDSIINQVKIQEQERIDNYNTMKDEISSSILSANQSGISLTDKTNTAISKDKELQTTLEEVKKYISGLDASQNVPQLALDLIDLKSDTQSNDIPVNTTETISLQGAKNSISDYAIKGRVEKINGVITGVNDAKIGVRGGKNLWNKYGRFDDKFDYYDILPELTNGVSTIPEYDSDGNYIGKRAASRETYGQKIKVKPHTDYVVCYAYINADHGVITMVYGQTAKIINNIWFGNNSQNVGKFNSGDNTEIIVGFFNGHGSDSHLYDCKVRDIAVYEDDGSTTSTSYVYEDFKYNDIHLSNIIPETHENIPCFPLLGNNYNNNRHDIIKDNVLYKNSFIYNITGDEDIQLGVYRYTGTEQVQLAVVIPFLSNTDQLYIGTESVINDRDLAWYKDQVDMRDVFTSKGDGIGPIRGYSKGHCIGFALSYKTLGLSDDHWNEWISNNWSVQGQLFKNTTLPKFRAWLKEKNITVQFSITRDIEVPLSNIDKFFVYENSELYIEDVKGIPPLVSMYYKQSIKGSVDSLVNEVEKINEKIINLTDYVVENDLRITMLELGIGSE